MRHLHPGAISQQLDGEMVERAGAGRAVGDRSCRLLAEHDQIGERTGGKARMHHDQVRRRCDEPDRREVLARIIAEVLEQAGRRADGRARHHQDGVAIRRHFRGGARRNRAAGAAAIVDDDRLAQHLAHLVGDITQRDAGAAARRERDHERDRSLGIGLRCRRRGSQRRTDAGGYEQIGLPTHDPDRLHARLFPSIPHRRASLQPGVDGVGVKAAEEIDSSPERR